MTGNFQVKFQLYKKWSNLVVLPISILLLLVAVIFGGAWLYTIALLLLSVAVSLNFIWLVPTGYCGYKTRFEKILKKSHSDGVNFIIPVIEVGHLLGIREMAQSEQDIKKVIHRNNANIEYTVTYRVKEKYVPTIVRIWNDDFYTERVLKWLDACFDTFINQLTYEQLVTQKEMIEKVGSSLVFMEIDKRSSEATRSLGSHEGHRASFHSGAIKTFTIGKDTTMDAPELELKEWGEMTEGVMFFDIFSIQINKITFEKEFEEAMAQAQVAKANVVKAEQEKKAALILAEAKKQAKILDAEAEAEAIRKKGAAEAEAIELMGKKLRENPEYIAQTRAQNMPTTVAGEAAVSVLVGGETAKK